MQKKIGKEGIKWVRLFVPLLLELFMAQLFVPLSVTRAQSESELEGNKAAEDRNENSSADVSANLEIAKEQYQNIITSSPNEIKSLLDALMILQAA
jgi:cobalamin biosynthesis Mg chelatase CobN